VAQKIPIFVILKLATIRPKADCRYTPTEGGMHQVFFLKHIVGASKKKSSGAIGSHGEVPQILSQNPQIQTIMTNHPIIRRNWTQVVKTSVCLHYSTPQ